MARARLVPRLFIFLLIFICAGWLLSTSLSLNASDKNGGVAYVSYSRTLKESSILAQENKRYSEIVLLAKEASRRMQEKYYSLPEPVRREMSTIDKLNKNNALRSELGRSRRISQKVMLDAIEKFRVQNHYSVVFNKDIALNASEGSDISNEIIQQLKGVKVEYGALPTFDEDPLSLYN